MSDFTYQPIFEHGHDETPYRLVTTTGVHAVDLGGRTFLQVDSTVLEQLAAVAMRDVSHLLRTSHLEQVAKILDDPEASANDRFVAMQLLKNANVAAGMVLPSCQDTGTAIALGHKGQQVLTDGDDAEALSRGIYKTFNETNLRYSQMAPLSMYEEQNTGSNLPAQIEIYAEPGDTYELTFIAKGGGSANKSYLFQETRAILNPERLCEFLDEKIRTLGTAACPPYHLAIVIGGTSAEYTLKTVKLASAHELDNLPTTGNELGRAFRDMELEQQVFELAKDTGIGAQFGGKYFCHDVRVIRLPRHGASLPVGIGVSCSADRQIKAKITTEGAFLEQLETNPAQFLPEIDEVALGGDVVEIDLSQPMDDVLATLTQHPIRTRLSLNGPMVVARDIAHARIKDRLDAGDGMPQYLKDHCVYYAGPAKTPEGYASWLFRSDDRWSDGLLRRSIPGLKRLDGDARQGQPIGRCYRSVRRARRFLSWIDRRAGCDLGSGQHQIGGGARVPRFGDGSGVDD